MTGSKARELLGQIVEASQNGEPDVVGELLSTARAELAFVPKRPAIADHDCMNPEIPAFERMIVALRLAREGRLMVARLRGGIYVAVWSDPKDERFCWVRISTTMVSKVDGTLTLESLDDKMEVGLDFADGVDQWFVYDEDLFAYLLDQESASFDVQFEVDPKQARTTSHGLKNFADVVEFCRILKPQVLPTVDPTVETESEVVECR